MKWIFDDKLSWFQRLCWNVLKQGPIPEHVAIIMDGNRRYAKDNKITNNEVYLMGFEKMMETLNWCGELGIREISLYAFSLGNFGRPKDEVACLVDLSDTRLRRFLQDEELLNRIGLRVRAIGNLRLLPKPLQKFMAAAVIMTKKNNRVIMNFCAAYTSTNEICSAMNDLAEGVQRNIIEPSDINEFLLNSSLSVTTEPDLLIRTSGEVRLSDYLIWQSAYTVLAFPKVKWPVFSIWNFFSAVLLYQLNYKTVVKAKEHHRTLINQFEYNEDLKYVSANKDAQNNARVEKKEQSEGSSILEQNLLTSYRSEKEERRHQYIQFIKEKHREELLEMASQPE